MTKNPQMLCNGKICHTTLDTAHIAKKHQSKKRGVKLYVYECDICWYYHLTSKAPKQSE
jgi:hypothetical protein